MSLNVDAAINLMDVPDWSYLGDPIGYRDRRTGQPLKPEIINAIEARQWKALALTVIDGACPNDTLPRDWEAALRGMDGVAVASKWARDLVKRAYDIDVAYHPHGIDLDFFRQYPQDEARHRFKLPQDKYIILVNAVNRTRKMLPASFEAVAKFADLTGRKDILFWVHSHPAPTGIGHDLQGLTDAYGMRARGVEVVHTTRLPEAAIPWMYATASKDGMVLHLSGGEGFGCVVLESAACRVPVLVTDYTSQNELVPTDFQKIPVKALIPFPANNISWAWPDTDVAAERMAQLSSDKGLRTSIKRSGWEWATKYDWKRVLPPFEAWLQKMIDKPAKKPIELVAV